MVQQRFRTTMVLLIASGLGIPALVCHAEATQTTQSIPPHQKMVPTAMQLAVQEAVQSLRPMAAPGPAPNAAQGTTPSAAQRAAPNQPAQAPPVQVPAEFNDGIAALQSATGALAKAGAKWGGHKLPAVQLIGQALETCGQARSTSADIKSGPKEQTTAMEEGLKQLTSAKADFAKAQDTWGGRRDKAITLIDKAINELQTGIEFAKSHNTY